MISNTNNLKSSKHFRLNVAFKILIGMFAVLLCLYASTLFSLVTVVPNIHQNYIASFDGLEAGSNIGNDNYNYWGCHNDSKYAIHLVCDRLYSHEYTPIGKRTEDEKRVRDIYDQLISDGWTGGSMPNIYDVLPAVRST